MKRYSTTKTFTRYDGKRVFFTTHYPVINASNSDKVIITNEADYLDYLAYKYYGDPTLWWILALANNIGKGRLSIEPGTFLRVPTNINQIIDEFNQLNSK
jgi:hypothetical protein